MNDIDTSRRSTTVQNPVPRLTNGGLMLVGTNMVLLERGDTKFDIMKKVIRSAREQMPKVERDPGLDDDDVLAAFILDALDRNSPAGRLLRSDL